MTGGDVASLVTNARGDDPKILAVTESFEGSLAFLCAALLGDGGHEKALREPLNDVIVDGKADHAVNTVTGEYCLQFLGFSCTSRPSSPRSAAVSTRIVPASSDRRTVTAGREVRLTINTAAGCDSEAFW